MRYCDASISKIIVPDGDQIKIIEFMKEPKNFLIFCGNPGIGKTYFCASLVEWALKNFNSFRYWHEAQLLQRIRDGMDQYKGDYLKDLSFLIDDDFLMIDDIGSQPINDWREEIIFDTIDRRYNSMLPTVITSNLSREQIEEKYHHRIASRLFAKENIIIELHNAEDLRALGK